jgi:DNA-binding SARP family transcriptional activator/streptogramin lyase
VEFRVLGPLSVVDEGEELALGAAKQRTLLALLLLHRNKPVASERLIDWLWAGQPPAAAAKSLQMYVSGLRKVLGESRVETRGRSYLLRVEPGELDLEAFEGLVAEAEGQDPQQEAALLREGLALYRGEPLSELRYEEVAQSEIARLDELRLQALEQRIDADLACGRERTVLPELEALVTSNPLRERTRAQLMLALYRCGRQADALACYQQGRELLDEQLGLETGPELRELERRILEHDPELGPAHRPTLRRPKATRRRLLTLVAGGIVLVGAATAAAVTTVETAGGSPSSAASGNPVAGNDLVGVNPRTGRVSSQIPIPGTPWMLASSSQLVWVGNDDSDTVSAVRPNRDTVTNLVSLDAFPKALASGEGTLWALDPAKGLLLKVDPAYGTPVRNRRVIPSNPLADSRHVAYAVYSVAFGDGSLWITDGSTKLTQVDPATLKVTRRVDLHAPLNSVTTGGGSVWATSGPKAKLFKLDRHGRLTTTIAIVANPGPLSSYPRAVAVGEGFVWVLNGNTGTVSKIDPVQRTIAATITVDIAHDPQNLAVGYGACWIANGDGTLTRIDANTDAVTVDNIAVALNDIALAHGTVWVTANPSPN